jgi:peptide/nickel transport system permease protein
VLRYIVHRILLMIPTLFGVAILVFGMLRLMGGDPGRGDDARRRRQRLAGRHRAGTRAPGPRPAHYVQFGKWLGGMATGDFGVSMWTGKPVSQEIASRLQLSLQVAVMATVLAVLISIPLGNALSAVQGHLDRSGDSA